MRKLKVLVTGGAGFIGSNFVKRLLYNDDEVEVVNLDLLTYAGRLENIQDIRGNPRHRFVRGDIRNGKTVESIMKEGFDIVVNFAAETHVDRSLLEGGEFLLTDAYGTYILLESARKHNAGKFIQVSTDEVYGSVEQGSSKETDPLDPTSPYSASKAAGDLVALAFHKTYDLDVVVTRSSNNYGQFQYPEKLLPKLILRAYHNLTLPIYGDGTQRRDWLHVSDNCAAIQLLMQQGHAGEVYNIASGEEMMNLDVAKHILEALGKPESLIQFVTDRPGHDYRYSLYTSKVTELGWNPALTFEDGLKKTVDWYISNRWWWSELLRDDYFRKDTPWIE